MERLCKIQRDVEILGFNAIHYFEFGKDFSHPPERHGFWEMVYVDLGEINAVTDGIGRTLTQGQVIFHRPSELHSHLSNKRVPNNMLVVSFTSDSPAMEFFDKKIFTLDKTARTLLSLFIKEARGALGEIPGVYEDKSALDFSTAPQGSLQLLECYLTEFLLLLRRGGEGAGSPAKRNEDTRQLAQNSITTLITEYLKESIYLNISLADICQKFYIGKSKLSKLFGEYVGLAPIEYLNVLKITEAKRLLREDLSVSRVADLLRFSSIHSFSRAFKRAVGISPTEYKGKIKA